MSSSLSLHPNSSHWKSLEMRYQGKGEGQCIVIGLIDETEYSHVALHYGNQSEAAAFIAMLKQAVAQLPDLEEVKDVRESTDET